MTLKDMVNVVLTCSGLPENMWVKVIFFICYVLNKVAHKKLEKTPYEVSKGHALNLKYLKVWDCLANVGMPDPLWTKMDHKTIDSICLGYT